VSKGREDSFPFLSLPCFGSLTFLLALGEDFFSFLPFLREESLAFSELAVFSFAFVSIWVAVASAFGSDNYEYMKKTTDVLILDIKKTTDVLILDISHQLNLDEDD